MVELKEIKVVTASGGDWEEVRRILVARNWEEFPLLFSHTVLENVSLQCLLITISCGVASYFTLWKTVLAFAILTYATLLTALYLAAMLYMQFIWIPYVLKKFGNETAFRNIYVDPKHCDMWLAVRQKTGEAREVVGIAGIGFIVKDIARILEEENVSKGIELQAVMVKKNYRRFGVFRLLFESAMERLKQLNKEGMDIRFCVLMVWAKLEAAINIYPTYGFTEIDRIYYPFFVGPSQLPYIVYLKQL